ncbi:MAG: hypothetical protein NTV21_18300 [Planctomycetota bacterium]|nr:hypothetical protein [Planctomycetota bacterium]
MELDRRELVRASAAGLALFALPGMFAARARAEKARAAGGNPERARTRFLLVLHADRDARRRRELGECFGSFLLDAEPEQLAPLAVCDITSATTEEMLGLPLPGAPVHAVLVEPAGRVVPALVGELAPARRDGPTVLSLEQFKLEQRASHERIAAQLARVIPSSPELIASWAAQERIELGSMPTPTSPSSEWARRWPWQARQAVQDEPAQRFGWSIALAGAVHNRWRRRAPAGTVWGRYGLREVSDEAPIEFARCLAGPCGTGRVPEQSVKFLHFHREDEVADFIGPPKPPP